MARQIPMQKASSGMMKSFKDFVEIVEFKAFNAMFDIGKNVYGTAIPLTPKDTGALRNSARYDVERKAKKGSEVVISYGGANYRVPPTKNAPNGIVFYAITVHENLNNVTFKVGEPQFLLKAGNRTQGENLRILAKRLREVTKRREL